MDDRQRRILDLCQGDLPLEARPFRVWAEEAGVSQEKLIGALEAFRSAGELRRFGGVFNSRAMGWTTTLVGARVGEAGLEPALQWIAGLTGTTHVYVRDHRINVWFTLALPAAEDGERRLDLLRRFDGVLGVWSMPQRRLFKLKVRFPAGPEDGTGRNQAPGGDTAAPAEPVKAVAFSDLEQDVIRELQGDVELRPDLFEHLAAKLRLAPEDILRTLASFKERGILRRIGAVVRHRRLGYRFNAMVAAPVPEGSVEELGRRAAALPCVSHCYEREVPPEFPFNVFVMVHGKDEEEGRTILDDLRGILGPETAVLRSVREVKKESMTYF